MFLAGGVRDAREVLSKQRAGTKEKLPVLRRMCELARELREVLTDGHDLNRFGQLLHAGWEAKRSLESSISTPAIDDYYERGLRAGAVGGKLLGAGGGGFLLFFCEPDRQARPAAELSDLRELSCSPAPQGGRVVYIVGD